MSKFNCGYQIFVPISKKFLDNFVEKIFFSQLQGLLDDSCKPNPVDPCDPCDPSHEPTPAPAPDITTTTTSCRKKIEKKTSKTCIETPKSVVGIKFHPNPYKFFLKKSRALKTVICKITLKSFYRNSPYTCLHSKSSF